MSELGGEPACWAHLDDELDLRSEGPIIVDVADVDPMVRGAVWSLPHGGDLDANLVRLPGGDEIGRHTNDEVDVFVVAVAGSGVVLIDHHEVRVTAGSACLLPRGVERSIRAGADGLTYFTVHGRRSGLTIVAR
ncbi:MAG: cupin domain-containing protein [Ilumatobacter sp.]|nr:cupin domain-containing protein [Ilumatobacter sp.]